MKSYNLLLKGLEKGARTIGPLSKYESYDRWKTKFYEWLRAKVPNLFEPDNSLIEAADHDDNFIDYDKFVLLKFSFIELCYLCYILIYNVSSDNLSLSILKCFVSNIDL